MKISVNSDVCIGAGQCVLFAETVFEQAEDDGLVVLLTADPTPDQETAVREAGMLCPSGAIILTD